MERYISQYEEPAMLDWDRHIRGHEPEDSIRKVLAQE